MIGSLSSTRTVNGGWSVSWPGRTRRRAGGYLYWSAWRRPAWSTCPPVWLPRLDDLSALTDKSSWPT